MTPSSGTLRADPGFRRYLAAWVVSAAGTLITAVVLPVLVYRLTGSAAWTAAVVVVQAMPHLLLAPMAAAVAAIAARRNPRQLLCTADLTGGALLISIPLAWWNGGLSASHVLAVAGAVQAAFVLLELAHPHALHALAGPERTAAGGAALRGATGLVELMVPPLTGLAVTIVAPASLLTLDAASFVASALLVRAALGSRWGSRPGAYTPPAPPARGRVSTGLRLLRGSPPERALALAGTLHAAAGAAFLAMLLPWAERQLDVPPSGDARLALLLSCWGLGAIAGCSLFPVLIRRLGPPRLIRKGLVVSLACGFGAVVCTHWLPAVLVGLVWGVAHTVVTKAAMYSLGKPARPAVRLLWRGVGPATGAALAGALAVWSTPRAGLAAGVALLIVAALAVRSGAALAPSTLVDRAAYGDVAKDRGGPRPGIP